MNLFKRLSRWLCLVWRSREIDDDLNRELQSHLDLEAADQRENGLSHANADSAAQRLFGNSILIAEDVREEWGFGWLERFKQDFKYGIRTLRKSPGFTVVAVLTLALGIGANTSIFSIVNALILRPLPFPDAERLVRVYSTKDGAKITGYSWPGGPSALDFRDLTEGGNSFDKTVVYDAWRKNVSFGIAGIAPEEMYVGLAPAEYFEILGIKPVAGRLFTADENEEGKNYVAAISTRLWNDRFGGDPDILSRKLIINNESYSIVAVMPDVVPEWMERSWRIEVWTPFAFSGLYTETSRGSRGWGTLARLRPGIRLETAQAEVRSIAARLASEYPVDDGVGASVERLADTRAGAMRPRLYLLAGAVVLILLIACVNLGNLLMGRGAARQRELTLRAALGASRARLVQQLLVETLLLSLAGGVCGLMLAQVGVTVLARMQPAGLREFGSIGIDWRVLIFTAAVSLSATFLFGLAPAISGTRLNLEHALRQGGRSGGSGSSSQRMRAALVAIEMAMSLMLLVGAGLLVQSIARLQRQDLGIRQDHLLKGHVYLPPVHYSTPRAITHFSDDLASKVRAIPGVIDATVTTIYPPRNGWTQMLGLPGRPAERVQDIASAQFGVCDWHFVKACGIRLVRGRDFAESDGENSPPVALINDEFSRRYFFGQDPVGMRVHIGPPPFLNLPKGYDTNDDSDVTIIAVIADFRNAGLAVAPEPQILGLYSQHPLVNYGFKEILARTEMDPRLLAPVIQRQLQTMDPDLPFSEVETITEVVSKQTGEQRFTGLILVLFAVGGLALAAVGIYGVVSLLVTQRDQELAVRIALGATRGTALWLVLKQSLGMSAVGAVAGLAGAWSAQKLLAQVLFGISAVDPLTFAGAAFFLMVIAATSSVIPGLRVVGIDPAKTLREG